MRKYAAPILALIITVLAFFLPEYLSRKDDSRLLNQLHIIHQGEGEDFSQWGQLSIAEKLILVRSGAVQRVGLPQDTMAELQCTIVNGHLTLIDRENSYPANITELQTQELWAERMDQAYNEVYKLQKAGAMPPLWGNDTVLTLKRHSQSLYIDEETQMSFPVYALELFSPPYDLYLTVDSQSGRLMNAALAWTRVDFPKWDSSRVSIWKDYWHMDSLNPELIDSVLRDLRSQPRDKDQSITREIIFTYDGQSLHVPVTRRDFGSVGMAILWNCKPQELGNWQPMEPLLSAADNLHRYEGGH